MTTKDEEITQVTEQLDGLLDKLRANVEALNEILTRPAPNGTPPDGGGERREADAP